MNPTSAPAYAAVARPPRQRHSSSSLSNSRSPPAPTRSRTSSDQPSRRATSHQLVQQPTPTNPSGQPTILGSPPTRSLSSVLGCSRLDKPLKTRWWYEDLTVILFPLLVLC